MKSVMVGVVSCVILTGVAFAQRPKGSVSPSRHPNIAAAQKHCQEAFDRIVAAQRANEWDMKGHAQKAKDLLEHANSELKAAAEAANENKGK
jgi:hypothetical protein